MICVRGVLALTLSPSPQLHLWPPLCLCVWSLFQQLSTSGSLGLDAKLFSLSAHLWITYQEIMWHNWITSGYRGFTYCWGIWRMLFLTSQSQPKRPWSQHTKRPFSLHCACCPWGTTANSGSLSVPGDVLPLHAQGTSAMNSKTCYSHFLIWIHTAMTLFSFLWLSFVCLYSSGGVVALSKRIQHKELTALSFIYITNRWYRQWNNI